MPTLPSFLHTFALIGLATAGAAQSAILAPPQAGLSEPAAPWLHDIAAFDGAAATALPSALTPDQVLPWFNGTPNFSIGSNNNCLTQQIETTASAYAGYTLRPPNYTPSVGEVFYTHVVIAHPGNPCTGSAVGIEFALPPGVETAASAADPAFCFSRTNNFAGTNPRLINLATDVDYGCPQSFPVSANGRRLIAPNGGIGGGAWGMAFGFWLEFLIPLRATSPQAGVNSIVWTINPGLGQFGQVGVAPVVNGDVIFRTAMENNLLNLDICGVTPTAAGC